MATRPTPITDTLFDYILSASMSEPEILVRLREETSGLPDAECQISAEQGQFMRLLVRLLGATKTLEVGTFTGYSSTAVALELPEDGRMVCCDVSDEWTAVARRYWKEAGVDHKIELRLAPGGETLQAMLDDGEASTFDFAFIDADKEGYPDYYEKALGLLRRGGLIMLDNMLAGGRVADKDGGSYAECIRTMNTIVKNDPRVTSSLLQVGDGVLLAVKN